MKLSGAYFILISCKDPPNKNLTTGRLLKPIDLQAIIIAYRSLYYIAMPYVPCITYLNALFSHLCSAFSKFDQNMMCRMVNDARNCPYMVESSQQLSFLYQLSYKLRAEAIHIRQSCCSVNLPI